MSLFKGNLNAANLFTAQDDVRGLSILKYGTAPSFIVLEAGDGVNWHMWYDNDDNFRQGTTAPTSSNQDSTGSVMFGASNAGASKALDNLASVAVNTDLLPGATKDLGNSSNYWAEGYVTKLYGEAGATLTGSTNTWTMAGKFVIGSSGGGNNADFKYFFNTASKFIVFDEDADDIIISDATGLILGGSEGAQDGLKMEFDGTSDIAFSALTSNDKLTFGPGAAGANLDVIFKGATSTSDVYWDASADTLQILDDAILNIGGATGGTMDGVKIFYNASDTNLDIDAVNANDGIKFGSNTATDIEIHGASYDIIWTAATDDLMFYDGTEIIFGTASDLTFSFADPVVTMTVGGTDSEFVLEAYAAQTTAAFHIDGATNDWDGANDVGMLHLSADAALNHKGASLILATNSAAPIADAEGFLMRLVDTDSTGTATSHVAHILSAKNAGLMIDAVAQSAYRGALNVYGTLTDGTCEGVATYLEGDLSGTATSYVYGTGAWLNVGSSGVSSNLISALDVGIYSAASADHTGAMMTGINVGLHADAGTPPATMYMMRFNCDQSGATPDGLFQFANPESCALNTGAPSAANAYIPIAIVGYGTAYIPVYVAA